MDIGLIVVLLNLLVTTVAFISIKFNDLSHVEKGLKEIKENQMKHGEQINCLDKKFAVANEKIKNIEAKLK